MKWRYYGLLEIGVGMGAAAQFVRPDTGSLARVVIFAAGVRVIVDGIKRFLEFRRLDQSKIVTT